MDRIDASVDSVAVQGAISNWPCVVHNTFCSVMQSLDSVRAGALALEGAGRDLVAVLSLDDLVLGGRLYRATAPGFRAADYYGDPVTSIAARQWVPWTDAEMPPALPGAAELLRAIIEHDMAVIFLTGRRASRRAETVASLVRVGLAGDGADALFSVAELQDPQGALQMRPDDDARPSEHEFKLERCRMIERNYRIALNIGTQLSAMVAGDWMTIAPHQIYIVP